MNFLLKTSLMQMKLDFFYKLFPDCTLGFKKEDVRGGKQFLKMHNGSCWSKHEGRKAAIVGYSKVSKTSVFPKRLLCTSSQLSQ